MATKTKKPQKAITKNKEVKALSPQQKDLFPIILIMLFMAVDYLPRMGAADVMAPQWIYIAIVNVVSLIFVFYKKEGIKSNINSIFLLPLSIFYFAYFLLAGVSITWAINPIESTVVYSRLIITIIAYFNIAILLWERMHLFNWLARFFCILLFIQSLNPISEFFRQLGNVSLNSIIFNLKGNSANKNILAITLAIKIPFAMYCIYTSKSWWRLMYSALIAIAAFAIFIVNARASFLALLIQMALVSALLIYHYRKNNTSSQLLGQFGFLFIPVFSALLLSQIIISNAAALEDEKQAYGTVADRLGSISFTEKGSNNRLNQWKSAVRYISSNPISGAGHGNWKLAAIPYEREYVDDLLVTYHVHNDFLETTTETGLLGGIIYISIFIFCAFYLFKTFFSNTSQQVKIIAAFTLIIFSTYAVDAMFNFPMERPIMQMFFVFILAVTANLYLNNNKNGVKKNFILSFQIASVLLLIPATYFCYLTYQSMVAQAKYNQDVLAEKPVYSSAEVIRDLPSIPNMNAFAFPVDAIIARYLLEEKKYDSALHYLRKSDHVNPSITFNDFLKARIFLETKQIDSAAFYASKSFRLKPRAKSNLKLLFAVAYELKDSATITRAFNEAVKYRNEPWVWNDYLILMSSLNKNDAILKQLVDSAARLFPNDRELHQKKSEIFTRHSPEEQLIFDKGIQAFSSSKFEEAISYFEEVIKLNPNGYLAYENLGLSYFMLKDYTKTIFYLDKVIALNSAVDGKAEYIKGLAMLNLGDKKGCIFLMASQKKGFKNAQADLNTYCK